MTTLDRPPSLSHIGVIGVVPDYWDVPWQPRHHVMSRLSRYFTVVWLESPHVWGGTCRAPNGPVISGPIHDNLWVYRSQLGLPQRFRTARVTAWMHAARLRRARRWLEKRGCRRIVLYLWRPQFESALDVLEHDLSVYHLDDEYSFSNVETPVSAAESRLLTRSNQVVVHSRALLEKKGRINPKTMFVPNGVDFSAYATPKPEPADLASIPHPRIGYTGYVKSQLDWELIDALTLRHSDWSFVFVGAHQLGLSMKDTIDRLSRRANIFFLGAKTVVELASYPQHFDCCIMPYQNNSYTNYIYPMKLHEYLAGGRPVVGRRISSLLEYERLIGLADSAEEWSAAIQSCLSEEGDAADRRRERQAVAGDHDWNALTLKVARAIAEGLGESEVLGETTGAGQEPFRRE